MPFKYHPDMSQIYLEWQRSRNKGNPKFWRSEEFRRDYTRFELKMKNKMVYRLTKEEMRIAIMSSERVSYSTVSLGSASGADMLAVMQVFQSVCRNEGLEALDVKFTGVDLHVWELDAFYSRLDAIEAQGPVEFFCDEFYMPCDMEQYFDFALTAGKRFDFIVLSFAEVKTKIEFVAERLPELLRDESSRIFVIDNNIGPVRQLKDYGFRRIGLLRGKTTCWMRGKYE